MNFFRSEEHLRNLGDFHEKKIGGIITLNDLMWLFSRPYFTNRRKPDYFSRMGEYTIDMITSLEKLEHAGDYWRLRWFEKIAVSLAIKLGLM